MESYVSHLDQLSRVQTAMTMSFTFEIMRVNFCLRPCNNLFTPNNFFEWLPNTVATSHMTSDTQLVECATPYQGSSLMIVDNGNSPLSAS